MVAANSQSSNLVSAVQVQGEQPLLENVPLRVWKSERKRKIRACG